MRVNQKVAIPSIFILAHARLQNGSIRQSRNMLTQVGAQTVDGCLRNGPHSGIRIEFFPMQIEGNLEAPAFDIRQGVRQTRVRAMQPYRHFWRTKIRAARRSPKKKDLLSGYKYPLR